MSRLGVAVVKQYERGVVFRLGRLRNVREPGMRFMIPLVDRMEKVSLRTVTMPIPSQQIITKDNVSIGVAAVAYFRRVDPVRSIIEIENVESAVGQYAQTTVRNMVGRSTLDEVLSNTEALNEAIKRVLDVTTEQWGVLVQLVELKDIELPSSMQRAMAKQAEAEREKRAKIIAAEGEALSVGKLAEAADVIAKSPRSRSSCGTCRSSPRSRSRRTRRSSSPPSSSRAPGGLGSSSNGSESSSRRGTDIRPQRSRTPCRRGWLAPRSRTRCSTPSPNTTYAGWSPRAVTTRHTGDAVRL